jgi:hypothetical protein
MLLLLLMLLMLLMMLLLLLIGSLPARQIVDLLSLGTAYLPLPPPQRLLVAALIAFVGAFSVVR